MSKKVENYEQKYLKANKDIKTIDKEHTRALTFSDKIEIIEINKPSSQALKSFSVKLMQLKARLDGGCNNER